MSVKLFDSHAHYYDARFASETEQGADAILSELFATDIGYIVNVGTSNENNPKCLDFAARYENMYAAVGIHPGDCAPYRREAIAEFRAFLEAHRDFKKHKIVAIGEIGLDYHYPDTDKEKQMRYFEAQMCLAQKVDIPVCIHDREAHGDVMEVIRRYPKVRGVLHSFSGSAEMAEELIKLGWMISFSGTLTFTNAKKPREVAARIPKEFVMIETDCPYLAPHPLRGSLNHSGNLEYTNAMLASIWGVTPEESAEITEQNAKHFFNLK